ncbi:hypothetical protein [Actinomadura sp. 3N407]|uniref:hypothetical protein n=1 Tax=Actinomadura sp. 3N407 TaxID=3457423 RepID=UPI003FCD68D0
MRPDDTPRGLTGDAYVARQSWRVNLPTLVALGAVDVFFLYRTIRYPEPGLVAVLAVFGAVTALAAFFIVRPIRRGEVSFAVDSGGVYFGPSRHRDETALVPWSWIDCIVTFDLIFRVRNGRRVRRRCVGVELNAMGVAERMGGLGGLPRPPEAPPPTAEEQEFFEAVLAPWLGMLAEPSLVSRPIEGWRLDMESLAKAVMRFAPDKPIERRPTRREPGVARLALTAAWEAHQNQQRFWWR